jgi:hypothetical protein
VGGSVEPPKLVHPEAGEPLPPTTSKLTSSLLFGGQNAPVGVAALVSLNYRWDYSLGRSKLLRYLETQIGVTGGSTPAFARWGAYVENTPMSLLQVRLQYDGFEYFGTHGILLDFPSADAPYSDSDRKAMAGSERSGTGYRLMARPTLRARFGRFLVRDGNDIAFTHPSSTPGFYYNGEYDTLTKDSDWILMNRALVMVDVLHPVAQDGLLFGAIYQYTHTFGTDISSHRAGAAFAWTFADRFWGANRPRLVGMGGVVLSDRYRTGDPFVTLAITMDWDLWSSTPAP